MHNDAAGSILFVYCEYYGFYSGEKTIEHSKTSKVLYIY